MIANKKKRRRKKATREKKKATEGEVECPGRKVGGGVRLAFEDDALEKGMVEASVTRGLLTLS